MVDFSLEEPPSDPQEWLPIPANLGDTPAPLTLSGRRLRRWGLVLEARGIPFRPERRGFGWHLLVPAGRLESALQELRRYEAENRHWPPAPPPPSPSIENTFSTFIVLALLAVFHNTTLLHLELFGHHPVDWIGLGNAHAGRIFAGQWWRTVTALTLHSDWLHLLSNLAAGGFFIARLCRELGSGLAWSLVLAAGTFGNLANAWLQSPGHRAVGASTAVFGALGLLAALSVVRYRHHRRRRWLLPIAAALALLAFLGTEGERTDLGAHLFGLVFGLLLGLATAFLIGRYGRPTPRLGWVLALTSAMVVSGAWLAALVWG